MHAVWAYSVYLTLCLAIAIWTSRALAKHGPPFLTPLFGGRERLVHLANQMFVVGFAVIAMGFAAFSIEAFDPIHDAASAVEYVSTHLGFFLVFLAALYWIRLFNLQDVWMRGQRRRRSPRRPPTSPQSSAPPKRAPFDDDVSASSGDPEGFRPTPS